MSKPTKRDPGEVFDDIRQEGQKRAEEKARGQMSALDRLAVRQNSDTRDEQLERVNRANQTG
jgi:hypothetical protein